MFWNLDQAFLVEYDIFGKQPVNRSAKRRLRFIDVRLAVNPFLHECRSHPVPGLDSGYCRPDSDNFARSIGKGNPRQLHPRIVCAGHHHQVPVIQRKSAHLHQRLARSGNRLRLFDQTQSFYPEPIANLKCLHAPFSPSSGD
jgi:hypothetical protein